MPNGVIETTYECHCYRCERPALGLGFRVKPSIELSQMGWKKVNGKWVCGFCLNKASMLLGAAAAVAPEISDTKQ